MPKREPGETWRCEACGEALIGALTKEGRTAPLEHASHEDGNVLVFRPTGHSVNAGVLCCRTFAGGVLAALRREAIPLRRNHFASCPHADRFRHSKPAIEHALTGE